MGNTVRDEPADELGHFGHRPLEHDVRGRESRDRDVALHVQVKRGAWRGIGHAGSTGKRGTSVSEIDDADRTRRLSFGGGILRWTQA